MVGRRLNLIVDYCGKWIAEQASPRFDVGGLNARPDDHCDCYLLRTGNLSLG